MLRAMAKTLRLTEQQLSEFVDRNAPKRLVKLIKQRKLLEQRVASKRNHPEDDEQMALFQWVALHINRVPELGLLIHIPNGGARNPREAARFKKMGVKAGVSDLLLPVSKEQYDKDGFNHFQCGGLWIEMKAKGRYLTGPQRKWQDAMTIEGYRCRVCYSWQEAAREIADYLGREEIKP